MRSVRFRRSDGRAVVSIATETHLNARGLYLDLPAWGYHVFDVERSA